MSQQIDLKSLYRSQIFGARHVQVSSYKSQLPSRTVGRNVPPRLRNYFRYQPGLPGHITRREEVSSFQGQLPQPQTRSTLHPRYSTIIHPQQLLSFEQRGRPSTSTFRYSSPLHVGHPSQSSTRLRPSQESVGHAITSLDSTYFQSFPGEKCLERVPEKRLPENAQFPYAVHSFALGIRTPAKPTSVLPIDSSMALPNRMVNESATIVPQHSPSSRRHVETVWECSPTASTQSTPDTRVHAHEYNPILHAPTPLHPRTIPNFLDVSPPDCLPSDFFDNLCRDTVDRSFYTALPLLSRPDLMDINEFTSGTFWAATQLCQGEAVVNFWGSVFRFWNAGNLILSGAGTSSTALEWVEVVCMDLIDRLKCALREVVMANSYTTSLDVTLSPLLEFIVDLQSLSETAPRARRALMSFLETLLGRNSVDAWPVAQCVGFVLAYYERRASMDRDFPIACLEELYEGLGLLIQSDLEIAVANLQQDGSRGPILSMAYLLKYLQMESIDLTRLLPYPAVSRFLNTPIPTTYSTIDHIFDYGRCRAAAVLIVLACSDLWAPGCAGCVETSEAVNERQTLDFKRLSNCICSQHSPILDQEFWKARSHAKQGNLSSALEALLQLEAVDCCIRLCKSEAIDYLRGSV